MVTCPRCGTQADQTHLIPAEVITTGLLGSLGGPSSASQLEICGDCICELMDDEMTA